MPEVSRTVMIGGLRQKAAPLIEEARRLEESRQPAGAASGFRDAAAIMQKGFERLPKIFDRSGKVIGLVREIVQIRADSAYNYLKFQDNQEASYQLSYAAKCLENFAVQFDQPERQKAVDLLSEALRFRRDSLRLARKEEVSPLHLAFQLSYASRTMMFLQDFPHDGNPAAEIDQMIDWRREAGQIFQSHEKFKHAYFEFYFLSGLLYRKGAKGPSEIEERAAISLLSAEMAEAGGMETFRLIRSYRIAQKDYLRAGNEKMAQRVEGKISALNVDAQNDPDQ